MGKARRNANLKPKSREPNGRHDRTGTRTVNAITGTVLAYRKKEVEMAGLGEFIASETRKADLRASVSPLADPLNGSTLGLLRQRGKASNTDPSGVTQTQYEAGEKWANLYRRRALIMGFPTGSAKSPALALSSPGQNCTEDPSEETICEMRRQWSDCHRVLMDCGTILRRGTRVATICWDVCVNNRALTSMLMDDYGNLRAGLNVLARFWDLENSKHRRSY